MKKLIFNLMVVPALIYGYYNGYKDLCFLMAIIILVLDEILLHHNAIIMECMRTTAENHGVVI